MERKTFVRNLPFIDTKGFGFHFQKAGRQVWVEIPFVSISFRLNDYLGAQISNFNSKCF